MTIIEFLISINGVGQIWAGDGQFLGVLSTAQYDSNSIANSFGIYGGQFGMYSIFNSFGIYGGQFGMYSPYNPHCLNPPIIIYQGQPVLMVTRNTYAQTNGLPVIDPDFLANVYTQVGHSSNVNSMFHSGWN
ncbi:hypothetical protein NIES37_18660 [Tolypothrix tenuis PCC 7101]|uniref:Uncharacterized protein n=1 Tax=Tolypothrix tenuis PCC 7101 TaxID=231146 RepID=A0A1Z4MWR7_9CYAN|nr:hypothetical protein [Aulosira sp. FACHB-113]BAY97918.1 hypothetical protein NIES37_18660 [Tolypothrix tenuis PCC 7101]BAZ71575.1 hypothetical protein NIES50_01180 [Aulosira laxa NIES-50]